MLGLGAGVIVAAWLVGSPALAVVGIGIASAGAWGRLWSRRVAHGLVVTPLLPAGQSTEGDDVCLDVTVARTSRLPVGSICVRYDLGLLGEAEVDARGGRAAIVLRGVPRGRYVLGRAHVALAEPLGLERVSVVDDREALLTVYPRIVELPVLFTDSGARHEGGARARLRRPGGFELHAVREYRVGEPLRAVHWPSTARRGELMVKELDDVPRDDVVVVLDQQPGFAVGERGASALDAAVRAAGSIVRAHARRGRRVALVLGGGAASVVRVTSVDREWPVVLDALAAAEADASRPLAAVLADRGFPASRAPELVVVTPTASAVATQLEERAREGRATALVAIDTPTFVGAARAFADPALLRLGASGVRVAVVRRGDDLAEVLSGSLARSAACVGRS